LEEVHHICFVMASVLDSHGFDTASPRVACSPFSRLPLIVTYYHLFRADSAITALATPLVLFLLKYAEGVQFG
jgi:hypothetical protein